MPDHPNLERALASVPEMFRDSWHGTWKARPYLLDFEEPCSKCGAHPFRPCHTPTFYAAAPHAERKKIMRERGEYTPTRFPSRIL
jgi:hypothetical protein